MLRPDNMIKYPEVDLKLGIKSSLPSVKATLGLLMMFWRASNNPDELAYSKEAGNSIEVSDELKTRLIQKYHPIYSSIGISDEQFLERVNNNQLFKSQLESLIVAFELIWRVAKIKFDNNMPASSERTGGKRYPKTLLFTKNMDILDTVLSSDDEQYSKVLLSWIGLNIPIGSTFEAALLHLLVYISEEAVYKLTDGDQDIIFNMNSVYMKLLEEEDSTVDINDRKEAKGSLRILKSALSDKLNPFLTYSNANGVAIKDGLGDKLRAYQKRVDASLSLSNTRYVLTPEVSETENMYVREGSNEYTYETSRVAGGRNILLYGVPGSGKSWTIEHEYCKKDSNVERLVFHPDYTYSDFIGQILPDVSEDGQVSYKFTPGPFTTILHDAYVNPQKEYILIIEEINRGNAPAIFGEVFQLLDRKVEVKDDDDEFPIGTSEYGITNKNIALEVYGDARRKVRIPSNLSIIGTMNTSDQNVFTLDTAFQRRWEMRMIENSFERVDSNFANAEILDTTVTWKNFCVSINDIIVGNNARMTSAEDKRLGAYFVHLRDLKYNVAAEDRTEGEYESLCEREKEGILTSEEEMRLVEIRDAMQQNRRFPEKVIKYLWDDAFKFSREVIFETNEYQSLEAVIRKFMQSRKFERFVIFRQNVRDAFTNQNNTGQN